MRKFILAAIPLAALAACDTTPDEQSQLIAAGQTLAGVAAAHNTTVTMLVLKGALFCEKVNAASPLVVALADISGAPVSVTNQTAAAVATACAAVQGVPVSPPIDPASAPVVTSGVALPPA